MSLLATHTVLTTVILSINKVSSKKAGAGSLFSIGPGTQKLLHEYIMNT